jgi:hypothetical protein
MSRPLNLTILAVLLAALLAGADSAPGGSATPPASGREPCQIAVLRNGFTIQFGRRELTGQTARLWLCPGPDAGYVEFPSGQIERYEQEERPVPPTPASPASGPETTGRGAQPLRAPIDDLIAGAANRHQIDPDFVASVVKAESAFVTTAASSKGALGLMQLMPQTAARLGVEDPLDPGANVEGGTRFLRQLLDLYDGDAVRALAAYNAGPQRVRFYGGVPPFRETRAYVTRIIEDYNRKKLRQQDGSNTAPVRK